MCSGTGLHAQPASRLLIGARAAAGRTWAQYHHEITAERKLETVLIPHSRCSYSPPHTHPMHYGKSPHMTEEVRFLPRSSYPRCKHCASICVALGGVGVWRGPPGKPWGTEEPCWVRRATAQALQGGNTFDLHGLFLTGLSSSQRCLNQFLHFRWTIMKGKKGTW